MWTFTLPANFGMISVSADFNLVVGWLVGLNQTQSMSGSTFLNVQYTPFAWGWADAYINGNTYLGMGMYNTTLWYARAYTIIDLQIYGGGEVCFMGTGYLWPVQVISNLSSALASCQAEIISDIVYGLPIVLGCNNSVPFNMTHLNISFTMNNTYPVMN